MPRKTTDLSEVQQGALAWSDFPGFAIDFVPVPAVPQNVSRHDLKVLIRFRVANQDPLAGKPIPHLTVTAHLTHVRLRPPGHLLPFRAPTVRPSGNECCRLDEPGDSLLDPAGCYHMLRVENKRALSRSVSPPLLDGRVGGRAGFTPAIADMKSALPPVTEKV